MYFHFHDFFSSKGECHKYISHVVGDTKVNSTEWCIENDTVSVTWFLFVVLKSAYSVLLLASIDYRCAVFHHYNFYNLR